MKKKQIAFCKGCRMCAKTGKCNINDDMQEIAGQMKTCDRIILAAPAYWANIPAAVKNLFDRLFGIALEETSTFSRPRLNRKQRYLLLTACNIPAPFSWLCGQSRGALRAMEEFFKTSGMKRLCKWNEGKVLRKPKSRFPKGSLLRYRPDAPSACCGVFD